MKSEVIQDSTYAVMYSLYCCFNHITCIVERCSIFFIYLIAIINGVTFFDHLGHFKRSYLNSEPNFSTGHMYMYICLSSDKIIYGELFKVSATLIVMNLFPISILRSGAQFIWSGINSVPCFSLLVFFFQS